MRAVVDTHQDGFFSVSAKIHVEPIHPTLKLLAIEKQAMCEIIYFYKIAIHMGTCGHYMEYENFHI